MAHRVLDFVVRASGARPGSVHLETTLAEDLGLDGDDADQFLESYAQEFRVDFHGFDFHEHFGNEGSSFIAGVTFLLLVGLMGYMWQDSRALVVAVVLGLIVAVGQARRWQRADPAVLRVRHLVEAARRGYWSRSSA